MVRVENQMKDKTMVCLDVYYYEDYANACGIVFETEPEERVLADYSEVVKPIAEYIPGEFYKRELPCLLKVIDKIQETIDLIIIDSFVWLGNGKKGLGVHLYEALSEKIPVIGVAKTHFKDCAQYTEVYRGKSKKPLYVSAIGIELDYSTELIKKLKGDHRIPDLLKRVDQLSRTKIELANDCLNQS
ncbi:MAG TPA: endonuclease V [Bacillota bacterium]|jgi:deoxyribonuclease V|nr:endonuclease V [Bacillota bacterium]HOL08559.1 endonuclease V [Bacillota bacterium]HPO96960.1 endonuclease V [Bacillota bacterium]